MLLSFRGSFAKMIGFPTIYSNALISFGDPFVSIRYAIMHMDLNSSEPAWKLVLLPAFIASYIIGVNLFHEINLYAHL